MIRLKHKMKESFKMRLTKWNDKVLTEYIIIEEKVLKGTGDKIAVRCRELYNDEGVFVPYAAATEELLSYSKATDFIHQLIQSGYKLSKYN